MRRALVVVCLFAMAACDRAATAVPALSTLPGVSVLPDTLHVVPLFDFPGGKGGGLKETSLSSGGVGGLVGDPSRALFGVTNSGGAKSCAKPTGCGLVFELTPQSGTKAYQETVIHEFTGTDGAFPEDSLVKGPGGALYGTTRQGGSGPCHLTSDGVGAAGCGTVFKIAYSHAGWTYRVLHSFNGWPADGAYPYAPVVFDDSGALYGTTASGGEGHHHCYGVGCGTVFKLTPTKSGFRETIIYSFGTHVNDGSGSTAGLVVDSGGALYGTTEFGGKPDCNFGPTTFVGCGTAFKLTPSSSGYTESILHYFVGGERDGYFPQAGLALESNGDLLGTTIFGGNSACISYIYIGAGCGLIFEISPGGSEKLVHLFTLGHGHDAGFWPQTPLVSGHDGYFYGTTAAGGILSCGDTFGDGSGGCGTVFRLSSAHSFELLYRFPGGKTGGDPSATLLTEAKALYGETLEDGVRNHGTAFKLPLAQ